MSDSQIDQLRDAYSLIDAIDPTSEPAKKLFELLDTADDDELLVQLKRAKIKFISPLAFNRMIRRGIPDLDSTDL